MLAVALKFNTQSNWRLRKNLGGPLVLALVAKFRDRWTSVPQGLRCYTFLFRCLIIVLKNGSKVERFSAYAR